jgi:hypothetical protein
MTKEGSREVRNPDGSRRSFLRAAGTLPAVVTALSNEGAAQQPAQALPQVKWGKYSISRLVCGSNPFGGLSHLSAMINYEFRQYFTPENIVKMLHKCQAEGINTAQNIRADVYKRFAGEGGKMQVFSNGQGDPARIAAMLSTGTIGIHHFGVTSDVLYKQGKLDTAREYLKHVRDAGVLVGFCSHIPEVIETVESQGWDIDYYMTCVYQWGRTREDLEKMYGDRKDLMPIEAYSMIAREGYSEVFLSGDPPKMYKVIRQVKKPCLAYKILAAGRKAENPKVVEQAFQEAFGSIKPTDAIIVGMYDRYIDQVAENAEYTRRFGSGTASKG